jgi:hypothetical protein
MYAKKKHLTLKKNYQKSHCSQAWWPRPVVPTLEGLRQGDHQFEANIVRPHFKKMETTLTCLQNTSKVFQGHSPWEPAVEQ